MTENVKAPLVQENILSWYSNPPKTLSIDTEFIWRTTYWPKPALLQSCHANKAFILDPLNYSEENFDCFKDLLTNPSILKIFHAAHDDLVILDSLFKCLPDTFIDTQHAALFCGANQQMGLDKIALKMLGVELDKSCQGSNWLTRPLSSKQLNYAVQDVAYLEDIWAIQSKELQERSYIAWLEEDMTKLLNKIKNNHDPWQSWRQVPPRNTSPRAMAYAQVLTAWRELHAQEKNKPIQHIVNHDTLARWSDSPFDTEDKWLSELLLHKISLTIDQKDYFFSLLKQAENMPEEQAPQWPHRRLSKKEDALIKNLKKELKTTAQELDIPEFLIASRKDLVKFIWHKDSSLSSGWRYEIFGKKMLHTLD